MKTFNFTSWTLWIFLGMASLACAQQTQNQDGIVETVEADRFQQMLSDATYPQLIDVRTDQEVAEGMIPGAVQMNITDRPKFESQVKELDPDKPVMVYCRSGRRSAAASEYLHENGFKEVYDLKGGMISWNAKNKPVQKP